MATETEILNELSSIAYKKWRKIGIQIRIPKHKLDEFADKDDPLFEVLDYWKKGNIVDGPIKFCWESVVDHWTKSQISYTSMYTGNVHGIWLYLSLALYFNYNADIP